MNLVDRLLCEVDNGLRTLFAEPHARRPMPTSSARSSASAPMDAATPPPALDAAAKEESIRLMRVNHCGEVCAQALYQGQALAARDDATRKLLLHAADEERDHLAWCAGRLDDLGGRPSVLAPAFYAGSFALGLASGMLGNKWSMGFLVETEKQVEAHLHEHLGRLDGRDADSRAVLEAMREDEIRHGNTGRAHGAAELPSPVKAAMRAFSRVMTRSTYRI